MRLTLDLTVTKPLRSHPVRKALHLLGLSVSDFSEHRSLWRTVGKPCGMDLKRCCPPLCGMTILFWVYTGEWVQQGLGKRGLIIDYS